MNKKLRMAFIHQIKIKLNIISTKKTIYPLKIPAGDHKIKPSAP